MDSMASQIATDDLDGAVFATGFPVPALAKLIVDHLSVIRPTAEQSVAIRKVLPEMSPSKVPAGSYSSQDRGL